MKIGNATKATSIAVFILVFSLTSICTTYAQKIVNDRGAIRGRVTLSNKGVAGVPVTISERRDAFAGAYWFRSHGRRSGGKCHRHRVAAGFGNSGANSPYKRYRRVYDKGIGAWPLPDRGDRSDLCQLGSVSIELAIQLD